MAGYDLSIQLGLSNISQSDLNKVKSQVEGVFKNLNIPVNIESKKVTAELAKINSATKNVTDSTEELGIAVGKTAKTFTAYIIARSSIIFLSNTIGEATRNAIQFEREVSKIAQTINKENLEVKKLTPEILKISAAYGVSNVRVAETVKVLTQAGFSFNAALKGAELLSKTTLSASFDNLTNTTESLIAAVATFNLTTKETEQAFNSIALLSKNYAVESNDLVEAIKRTGGVFSATGGNVQELIALMTSVRSTTRETADTIATGFRTIFTRLQRPKTIQFFRDLGIELQTTEGEFIGNFKAIEAISAGLTKLGANPGTIKFAQIVEEIGGSRQVSRVIPLLTQIEKSQRALNEANSAGNEIDKDVLKSKDTLASAIERLRQNFSNLLIEISQDAQFQITAKAIIGVANAIVETARAIKSLIPLITVLSTIKVGIGISEVFRGKTKAASLLGLADGGPVPGSGRGDKVPALLEPGEFVVTKDSANAFGYANLRKINKYAEGGIVESSFRRSYGNKVENLGSLNQEISKTLAPIIFSISDELFDFLSSIKTRILKKKELPSLLGGNIKGNYLPENNIIGLNKNEATQYTARHEFGHAIDRGLSVTQGLSGLAASQTSGTFQNVVTEKLKPILESYLKTQNISKEKLEYRLRNEEIFADLIANTTAKARQILASTTDSAVGMSKLASLINQSGGSLAGFAGLKASDFGGNNNLNVRRKRKLEDPFGFAYVRNQDIGSENFKNLENLRKKRLALKDSLSRTTEFGGFSSFLDPRNAPTRKLTPSVQKSGFGFTPQSKPVVPVNTDPNVLIDLFKPKKGKGLDKVEEINEPVENVKSNMASMAIGIAVASQAINFYAKSNLEAESATVRVVDKFSNLVSVLAGVAAALSTFGISLNKKTLTDLFSNKGLGRNINIPNLPSLPKISTVKGAIQGTVGGIGDFARNPLGAGGKFFNNTKGLISDGFNKLPKFGGLGVGLLAGGLALGAGELIDAGRGFTATKEKNIKEGKVDSAGKSALEEANQKTLTNLAAAAIGLGAAFGPIGLAIGLTAGALIKFSDSLGESYTIVKRGLNVSRDFFANLGLADSTAIIESNARAAAAVNAFATTLENSGDRLKKELSNLTNPDKNRRSNLADVAGGGSIKDLVNALKVQLDENAKNRNQLNKVQSDIDTRLKAGPSVTERIAFGDIFGVDVLARSKDLLGGNSFGLVSSREEDAKLRESQILASREADTKAVQETIGIVKPIIEKLAKEFIKNGGTSEAEFRKSLPEGLRNIFELSKNVKGGSEDILSNAFSVANVTLVGNFNDSLERATKSVIDFTNSVTDLKLDEINSKFDLDSLSSISGIRDVRNRSNAIGGLVVDTQGSKNNLLNAVSEAAKIQLIDKENRSTTQIDDLVKFTSIIDLETSTIERNIKVREELINSIKKEVEIEKQRTAAISGTLSDFATGDRSQRRDITKNSRVAQKLLEGTSIDLLSNRDRQRVPSILKLLPEEQQENIKRNLESFGAKGLSNRGIRIGGFEEVGRQGFTNRESDLRGKLGLVNTARLGDKSILNEVKKTELDIFGENLTKISKQLNDNKLVEGIDKLVNMGPIKVEFPTNFTVDVVGNQELMSVIVDQIKQTVSKEILNLKNGVQ